MSVHRPGTVAEVEALVAHAVSAKSSLAIVGGGTRSGLGRPVMTDATMVLSGLSGITLYEPAEMVMSAMAGTSIRDIRAALAAHRQMLPFEPMDHRQLYRTVGEPTIGGLVSTNASGPRRVIAGSVRDHVLGFQMVTGRAETIRSGGRVMKNVTGLDLPKLLTGAMGTLGVLTEITFKILPRPEQSATLMLRRTEPGPAIDCMTAAMGSPFEVSGAAYRQQTRDVLLRVEGFADSIAYRIAALTNMLGPAEAVLEGDASECAWFSISDASALEAFPEDEIWRVSVAPSKASRVVATLPADCRLLLDWSGGLLWIGCGGAPVEGALRAAVAMQGGHATLVRASEARRASTDVFQPMPAGIARITAGVKSSFDPLGIFNPGRMYAGM